MGLRLGSILGLETEHRNRSSRMDSLRSSADYVRQCVTCVALMTGFRGPCLGDDVATLRNQLLAAAWAKRFDDCSLSLIPEETAVL